MRSRRSGPARRTLLLAGATAALLGACAQAPVLKLPEMALPAGYKEAAPWTSASPADRAPRTNWWTLYGDVDLDTLQQRLVDHSPDLAAALARYQQSRAATDQIRSSLYPTLAGSLNVQRDRQAALRPLRVQGPLSPDRYSSDTIGLDLEYEVDLWGRLRGQVDAGEALDQAAQADLESARLSLQAQLADSYIALRGLDQEALLLRETEAAYARALDLVRQRHDGGIASGLDLARAQGQFESTRSQRQQSDAQRAVVEHSIAALVGEAAGSFSIPPRQVELRLPQVPTGLPSTLLQRRADIAAAQRRVAASNANVGVARAALYPSVMLSAQGGFQSSDIGRFIQAPNLWWALGPTLAMSLFDAGKRRAEVVRVQAVLDEVGAKYRSVVIGAFQQVEDNLALIGRYEEAQLAEQAAAAAAQRSLEFSQSRYRQGAASYLEVVTSQTTALQARRSALDLATRSRRASVQLIRALGGGWTAPGDTRGSAD